MQAARDFVTDRLSDLSERLAADLAGYAVVNQEANVTTVTPGSRRCLPMTWTDGGDSLRLVTGHIGGLWEFGRETGDVELLEEIVLAVIAGEAAEVFGSHRSLVEVQLDDGAMAMETGYEGWLGSVPMPGWRVRGRRVRYLPPSRTGLSGPGEATQSCLT